MDAILDTIMLYQAKLSPSALAGWSCDAFEDGPIVYVFPNHRIGPVRPTTSWNENDGT